MSKLGRQRKSKPFWKPAKATTTEVYLEMFRKSQAGVEHSFHRRILLPVLGKNIPDGPTT